MDQEPDVSELNAMDLPSGDQVAQALVPRPIDVNCREFEPSLSHVQISRLPDRLEQNAIRRPSGEGWGFISSRVDEITNSGGRVIFGPLTPTRHTFWSEISFANTRRCARCETERGASVAVIPARGRGVPPETGIRQSRVSPVRSEETTNSLPL